MKSASSQVDAFSNRLSSELAALSWRERNELFIKIGRMELRMRSDGQDRPVWKGPISEDCLLGKDVVVPTEQGEQRGRVICFGVLNMGAEYERSVVVHVPASGTHHEVAGSFTRIADSVDSARIADSLVMAARLIEAIDEADNAPPSSISRGKSRQHGQKDPQLVRQMLAAANAHNSVRSVEEGVASHKITGIDVSKRIYVFHKQLRVDVSGFSFDHVGLRRIPDEEAHAMHLGRVRGQLLFDDKNQAMAAFKVALEGLR